MRDDQLVTDEAGTKLAVGMKAVYGMPTPGREAESIVTIVGITDYDVDYCDETQRPECFPPQVKVRFDIGGEDTVSTHDVTRVTWNDYPDGPSVLIFQADDLEAVKP